MSVTEDKLCENRNKSAYPWNLFIRTCFLLVGFLFLGLTDAVKGPTLLDLKDLYNVTLGEISFIILLGSIGGLVGCFGLGTVMDRLRRYRYLVTAGQLILFGTCIISFPLFPHVAGLFTVAFFGGIGSASFDAGGQVVLLDIWRGRDSGPYMHALHFFFGIGAFLAPLIARAFLINSEELDIHGNYIPELTNTTNASLEDTIIIIDDINDTIAGVESVADVRAMLEETDSIFTIQFLYPLVGSLPILLSFVFIIYFINDERNQKSKCNQPKDMEEKDNQEIKQDKENENKLFGIKLVILIIMMLFFFLYVGQEVAFGTFISVFAVRCKLGLTRQQGSDLAAVFWGTFAGTRGLAVPAAIWIPSNVIMTVSMVSTLVAAFVLTIYGETNIYVLFVSTSLLGFGMASIYATGLLWLEKRIVITNRIGAAMAVSSSLGAKIFPVAIGQTVEKYPMSLMYMILGTSTGCTLLFIINSILTLKLLKTAESHESMNPDELKKITNEEKGYTNNEIETDNEFTNDNETQSIKLQENVQPYKEMMQDAVLERKGGGEKS